MTEAESRVATVQALNGAEANIILARDRLTKAVDLATVVSERRAQGRELYKKARERLLLPGLPAEERLTLTDAINQCLAAFVDDDAAWQKAKSEAGTASAEVDRFETERTKLLSRLASMLPDLAP